MSATTVWIFQNGEDEGEAYLSTFFSKHHIAFRLFQLFRGEEPPSALDKDCRGMVILGGSMGANDPMPYYPALFGLIDQAVAEKVPILGICLGSQILAKSQGGRVYTADKLEYGWIALDVVRENKLATAIFGDDAQLTSFSWHNDTYVLPDSA